MSGFRGSDEVLEAEIVVLEAIARQRLRRYTRELNALERELSELKSERARRRARSVVPVSAAGQAAA
ncbi:MAG TPA: hypothetical protein VFF67_05525 [Thermoplasmata archaeon]|nr:hypothetical protein [Thermoplasmata archaeon]